MGEKDVLEILTTDQGAIYTTQSRGFFERYNTDKH
jgi:hypothetical protein